MTANIKKSWFDQVATATCIVISMLVAGCSGSGGSDYSNNNSSSSSSSSSTITMRVLSADFSTRKAIAYSPYRGSTMSLIPTDQQILQDLQLMYAAGFKLIRLYDAGAVPQRVLRLLAMHPELDIKVMLGIWITGPASDVNYSASNQATMDEGIAVALNSVYSNFIEAVSVGNETMLWSGLHAAELANDIRYVRNRIPQPITTDDVPGFYLGHMSESPLVVLREIDFASVHPYAWYDASYNLWDWRQTAVLPTNRAEAMMNAAINWTRSTFTAVRNYMDSNGFAQRPIVIGETGWKTLPSNNEIYLAHPVNQKMFYDLLRAWDAEPKNLASPAAIFYFEAFDEPWKATDDKWGLWNVDRLAKYALWLGSSTGFDASVDEPLPSPPNDVAVYYTGP